MPSLPSELPEWADGGGATVVDPSLGQKQSGWTTNQVPTAGNMNWWMLTVYRWVQVLSALGTYAWTWVAAQTFNGGVFFFTGTGTAAVTTQASAAGHGLRAIGSTTQPALRAEAGAGQPAVDLVGDAQSSGKYAYAAAHSRAIYVRPGELTVYSGTGQVYTGGVTESWDNTGGSTMLATARVSLPAGGTLQSVEILAHGGPFASGTISAGAYHRKPTTANFNDTTFVNSAGAVTFAAGATPSWVDVGLIATLGASDGSQGNALGGYVIIDMSISGCVVLGLRANYTVPAVEVLT